MMQQEPTMSPESMTDVAAHKDAVAMRKIGAAIAAAMIFGICVSVACYARVADRPNVGSIKASEAPGAPAAGGERVQHYEDWHGNNFVLRPYR
jgi:hypothetical protein